MPKINHEYVISFARRMKECSGTNSDFTVLDYGCGAGQVVEMGLAQGLQISGVDVFYAGSMDREIVEKNGLMGKSVFPITDGRIPFPDQQFDLVVSNQVFEHVSDLNGAVAEIHRVLKSEGHMLALFPHAGVLWEAHMSLPLTHWFPRGSKMRLLWTFAWRCLGFGKHKAGKSRWAWTQHVLSWTDRFCFYRSREEIERSLGAFFDVTNLDRAYIEFRKSRSWRWRILAPFPKRLGSLNATIFSRLAGAVLLAAKASSGSHIGGPPR
jgi:SAM-dependent methyltransferase